MAISHKSLTGIAEHVRKGGKPLEWDMRLNIAIGSARGLCYLHHDCIPHIIHRDIKTSNILLDADMEPRVSDFGLAKLISPQQTHVTTMVAGTLGYLPPGTCFSLAIRVLPRLQRTIIFCEYILIAQFLIAPSSKDLK